ncbi:MAG: LeuA family protein [Candidatus Eisenbacteria bacterium]
MAPLAEDDLIHDWNHQKGGAPRTRPIEFDDETLRDGLQSPSVIDPPIEEKLRILHLMEALELHALDLGLPGSSARAFQDCLRLAEEIRDQKMRIRPNGAVRTLKADVDPLIELSMKVGYPVEAAMFIGSSPIRFYAEGWTLDKVHALTEEAVSYAVKNGIPVMYVTEDTTRTDPAAIRDLFSTAMRAGAYRICVADTVGHITPRGTLDLLRYVRSVVDEVNPAVKIDWHGHSDRGLSIPNALAAVDAGVDRIHGTALGIGERCGNTPMDQLLVNLKLEHLITTDLTPLADYCQTVSRATGVPIPINYPAMGRDAFRTSTGVHAAAIIKARDRGARWLADRVYSGVPAEMIGREQEIEIGFMSGMSNVNYYLRSRGIEPTRELEEEILARAKQKKSVLDEDEVLTLARTHMEALRAQLERAARGLEPARPDHPAVAEGGESGAF